MTYVIGANCIDQLDRSCIEVCPVDCIYVGDRKSYINANECIDCGACEVECPVDAIFVDRRTRRDSALDAFLEDSRAFFELPLPGRSEPLGDPGGAAKIGDVGFDTPFHGLLCQGRRSLTLAEQRGRHGEHLQGGLEESDREPVVAEQVGMLSPDIGRAGDVVGIPVARCSSAIAAVTVRASQS